MTSRWAQIEVKMAQMGPPSTSLVGKPFEWTPSEVSLDLYGTLKSNLQAGKIHARFFILMIRNLPLILEGIGTSVFQAYPMH